MVSAKNINKGLACFIQRHRASGENNKKRGGMMGANLGLTAVVSDDYIYEAMILSVKFFFL